MLDEQDLAEPSFAHDLQNVKLLRQTDLGDTENRGCWVSGAHILLVPQSV